MLGLGYLDIHMIRNKNKEMIYNGSYCNTDLYNR